MIVDFVIMSGVAGLAAFSGSLLGWLDETKTNWFSDKTRRAIIAFGGGALIGAVGLVLVPHGMESQPLWLALLTFLAGGIVFLLIDRTLQKQGTPVSQLIALNLDFIPEALVLGAVISSDYKMALFLAVIISAQNLPEGFNAYREMRRSHDTFLSHHILQIMALAIVIGPLAALAGFSLFTLDSLFLGSVMTFCAGGILYLVFEDVAPEAHEPGDWNPAFGAVIGFAVALIGYGMTR
ncbi:hypothetical protein AB1K62_12545 [Parasphingorhabdus sp. JC815]|uniref:ZIP family metal transporter n=1 Tax=Parasphingorhabdus sp. JC815 TaxID=3232140 RepID=UPI003457F050